MAQELEWKFAAPHTAALTAVLGAVDAPARTIVMRTTYYDTPDGFLAQHKWMLRSRLENGVQVVCCKTPLPDSNARGEWEVESSAVEAALPLLVAAGAPDALLSLKGLAPCCGAAFTRRAVALTLPDGTRCELACDEGALFGKCASLPLCEMELEFQSGDPAAAAAYAATLASRFGLRPETQSKVQRARALR